MNRTELRSPGDGRQDARAFYQLARFPGDYEAVKHGGIGKRLARRAVGRVTGRGLGRIFR